MYVNGSCHFLGVRCLWLGLAQEISGAGFFTEEEIWVLLALQQGSTKPKLREITGQISRLYDLRTRSWFSYSRSYVINLDHPRDYGGDI